MRPGRKLVLLAALYFAQGLPFGFQATALPVLLRAEGLSLTAVGFAHALALPWMLKILWAPAVDVWSPKRLGRRRGWILPMQVALAVSCGAAALLSPSSSLTGLLVAVFLMNLFAATMDIAVDGLAVDLLSRSELGYGNIAQVVGYKLGMLTGGGLLLWASQWIGWEGMFLAIAALVAFVFGVTLAFREPASRGADVAPSLRDLARALRRWLQTSGAGWVLLFVATYKLGESMADAMFKPFLVDAGYTESDIGLWVGTWGMVFSLAGSFAGGVLASTVPLLRAVAIAAVLRTIPVAGELWLSLGDPTPASVIAVTCAEHFFGGALTTAMFAFMMSRVDRRIGATHYTALAAIEVIGKSPAAWLSGILADAWGYPALFATAVGLSVAFLLLLFPLRRSAAEETEADS